MTYDQKDLLYKSLAKLQTLNEDMQGTIDMLKENEHAGLNPILATVHKTSIEQLMLNIQTVLDLEH